MQCCTTTPSTIEHRMHTQQHATKLEVSKEKTKCKGKINSKFFEAHKMHNIQNDNTKPKQA